MATTDASGGTDYSSIISMLGTLGSLGTGIAGANAQGNNNALAQAFAKATGTLNPFNATTGAGGISAGLNGGNPSLNYGSLQGGYNQFAGLAGNAGASANGITAPAGLNAGLSGAFGAAAGGLGSFNPSAAGSAANSAFLGAGNAATAAGGGYNGQVQQQLSAIKALQQPLDQQNFDMLQGSLFGNGQLGSSSGGLQTAAFARGLATENSQDILNAQNLGLQAQASDTATATGLGGLGQGLLSSAFGNFGQTAGLAPSIQGAFGANAAGAAAGAGSVTNQGLGLFNAGLQSSLGQNQASARAGALTSTNAQQLNASPMTSLLQGIFGSVAGNGGGTGSLGSLVSGGKSLYNLFGGGGSQLDEAGTAAANAGGPSAAGGVAAPTASAAAPAASALAPSASSPLDVAGTEAANAAPATSATQAVGNAAGAGVGAAAGASSAGSALGAGAPGVFASGNAAAGSAGTASSLTGVAGTAATAGFGALAALALTKGLQADAINNAGNKAMSSWMKATGTTFKAAPTQSNSGQNTFGTVNANGQTMGGGPVNGRAASSVSPGSFIGKDGKPLTAAQAHTAIISWAKANNMPYGNI